MGVVNLIEHEHTRPWIEKIYQLGLERRQAGQMLSLEAWTSRTSDTLLHKLKTGAWGALFERSRIGRVVILTESQFDDDYGAKRTRYTMSKHDNDPRVLAGVIEAFRAADIDVDIATWLDASRTEMGYMLDGHPGRGLPSLPKFCEDQGVRRLVMDWEGGNDPSESRQEWFADAWQARGFSVDLCVDTHALAMTSEKLLGGAIVSELGVQVYSYEGKKDRGWGDEHGPVRRQRIGAERGRRAIQQVKPALMPTIAFDVAAWRQEYDDEWGNGRERMAAETVLATLATVIDETPVDQPLIRARYWHDNWLSDDLERRAPGTSVSDGMRAAYDAFTGMCNL